MTLDEILTEIKNANTIAILTHESPDGDAIGSSLAMKIMVDYFGKNADVIIPIYSRLFSFLPKIKEIKQETEIEEYDLAISVDCADIKRLKSGEYFRNAKKTIVIDHHGSNNMYGDINFVNPDSPACCEILAAMTSYFDIPFTKELGTCIMAGIITDTGGFRHYGINPETFEFTADLIRIGVDIPYIYKKLLKTKTKANFELSKRVIKRLEMYENEKIAFSYITKQDEEEVNAEEGDHEGLVEIATEMEGIAVSVFLRQNEEKTGFKISLRSTNQINSSDICILFGGGGHPGAAGAFCLGTLEEVKGKILSEVIKKVK